MGKIKLQKIVDFAHAIPYVHTHHFVISWGIHIYDKLRKLYMNGTVILKVLAFLDLQNILGNFCFSEQIFHRKQSLGVPDFFYILNIDSHCMKESFRY